MSESVSLGFLLVLIGTIGSAIVAFLAWNASRFVSALALAVTVIGVGVLIG